MEISEKCICLTAPYSLVTHSNRQESCISSSSNSSIRGGGGGGGGTSRNRIFHTRLYSLPCMFGSVSLCTRRHMHTSHCDIHRAVHRSPEKEGIINSL